MRQSRHLLVSNLPENVSADKLAEHFKRFGKVQSVKLLPLSSNGSSSDSSLSATVAFTDIRSAAKAYNNPDNKIEDKVLKTDYYEPPASTSATIFIHETREEASLSLQRQTDGRTQDNKTSSSSSSSTSISTATPVAPTQQSRYVTHFESHNE